MILQRNLRRKIDERTHLRQPVAAQKGTATDLDFTRVVSSELTPIYIGSGVLDRAVPLLASCRLQSYGSIKHPCLASPLLNYQAPIGSEPSCTHRIESDLAGGNLLDYYALRSRPPNRKHSTQLYFHSYHGKGRSHHK